MSPVDQDIGVIKELLDRFNHQHLPRVLEIKSRLEEGKSLRQSDTNFLLLVASDSLTMRGLIERNPTYKPLATKILIFFHQVIATALENQESIKP
ncbi:MAG: hypothetical protein OQK04_19435 [Kangiellaceae bacterium]|nr:hypothetical protein [Kangiellaceae bacterium]MCW9000893.1 hypothetical protein [Kangiellaceae bacterium]